LAVAISYFEISKITNDIVGNGGPAPQSFMLLMLIYLIISLIIAALTNFVNRRLALIER
jgi:ABC-type amino acid transport system permease subunit